MYMHVEVSAAPLRTLLLTIFEHTVGGGGLMESVVIRHVHVHSFDVIFTLWTRDVLDARRSDVR